jgi:hypothetical protein
LSAHLGDRQCWAAWASRPTNPSREAVRMPIAQPSEQEGRPSASRVVVPPPAGHKVPTLAVLPQGVLEVLACPLAFSTMGQETELACHLELPLAMHRRAQVHKLRGHKVRQDLTRASRRGAPTKADQAFVLDLGSPCQLRLGLSVRAMGLQTTIVAAIARRACRSERISEVAGRLYKRQQYYWYQYC